MACTEIAVDAIARERTSIVFSCRLSATERRRDVCAQDVEMYSIRAGVVCNECGGGGGWWKMNAVYVCIGQAIWERPRLKYKKTGLQPLGLAGLLSWIEDKPGRREWISRECPG